MASNYNLLIQLRGKDNTTKLADLSESIFVLLSWQFVSLFWLSVCQCIVLLYE